MLELKKTELENCISFQEFKKFKKYKFFYVIQPNYGLGQEGTISNSKQCKSKTEFIKHLEKEKIVKVVK